MTVCLNSDCPVHTNQAHRKAVEPPPTMPPAPEQETEEEGATREAEHEQRMAEYQAEQERKAEERRSEFQRQQEQHEAERARIEELHQSRVATLNHMVENAPAMFNAEQLRLFLYALIDLNLYFAEDVASAIADDENNHDSAEEVLVNAVAALPDDKLTGFAVRLALTTHTAQIPHEGEMDYLALAAAAFALPQSKKASKPKKAEKAPVKASLKKNAVKKSAAA